MKTSLLQTGALYFLVFLGVAVLMSATLAFAQETNVSAEASVQAEVSVQPAIKARPLQLLNDVRTGIKNKAQGEVRDMKMEVRTDFKAATTGAERKSIMNDVREQNQEFRANIKERLQALFRTHLGSAIARLNAALRHFDAIVLRIESRIEKLNERGADTTSVEASLATSVGFIATAKVDVRALSDLLSSVTDTSDAATVKAEIRAAIGKAIQSVKAAHRALLETSKALVALVRTSAEINSETTIDPVRSSSGL